MRKKLFVFSDAHSFYTELKSALDEAGFDPNNPDHLLISCGDLFDRGGESLQLLNYIKSIHNKVIIFGNHYDLLQDYIKRGFPLDHDYHNGTAKTVYNLGGCDKASSLIAPLASQAVNYYETAHYIFTHSILPKGNDWRYASNYAFSQARWNNPFLWGLHGCNKTGKTVVFGHWHTSWMWEREGKGSQWGSDACTAPYYGDNFIGIDACTAFSRKVNVLVLEDDLL